MLRHSVFPVNTVGFSRSLDAFDGTLRNLVLFAEFRNLAGQRHALVCQFRRSILSAHLLDDLGTLRDEGFHLLGQALAIVHDGLQRWELVVMNEGVFGKDSLSVFPYTL